MKIVFLHAESPKAALAKCPWAVALVELNDGYICFECLDDYETYTRD